MKIFCIGRNYAEHAAEMKSKVPTKPMVFMKPSTALLLDNAPFYYPEFSENIHFEVEVILKVSKNGRHIQPEFASNYYSHIGLGIDFTARDVQAKCKEKGHPWEIAKAFDQSALVSPFIPKEDVNLKALEFSLQQNGEIVQQGNTKDLVFDFETLLVYISKIFTLQIGDLIFTGTPAGVGPVKIGDELEGHIGKKSMFHCRIK